MVEIWVHFVYEPDLLGFINNLEDIGHLGAFAV